MAAVSRREFVASATALLGAPLAAAGQQAPTGTLIAYVSPENNQLLLDAFRQGLREHGYVEGQNLTLEVRWAEGRSERFPGLIGELVRLKARAIVTISAPASLAAKAATTTTPIVFIAGDPLGSGLVPSLARPGGNLTGLSISLGKGYETPMDSKPPSHRWAPSAPTPSSWWSIR